MSQQSIVAVPVLARVALSLAVLGCLWLAAPSHAQADELGQQGVLVLSAENLFGFAHIEEEIDFGPIEVERDYNIFGLGMTFDATPMWTPRLAIDGYVIDGLSVGGALGLAFYGDDDDFDDDDDDVTLFLIAPRVGYTYMFTSWVGIWARGGFTYYLISEDDDDRRDDFEHSQFTIDLEAMFPFVLTEGFGIEVGAVAHIGLAGERGFDDDDDRDYQEWGIGIMVGLLGWLGV